MQEHQRNHYAFQVARFIKFRDEQHPMVDVAVDDLGIQDYHEAILHSPGVSYGWGSWLDGGTANTVLQRFADYPGRGAGMHRRLESRRNDAGGSFLPPAQTTASLARGAVG